MSPRLRRFAATYLIAAPLAVLLLGGATLGWATSRDAEPLGLRFGPADAPPETTRARLGPAAPAASGDPDPDRTGTAGDRIASGRADRIRAGTGAADGARDGRAPGATRPATVPPGLVGGRPGSPADRSAGRTPATSPAVAGNGARDCRTAGKLVPTCGVLWGVATERRGTRALRDFESTTDRHQDIYHAYHRGTGDVFPTDEEIAISREPGRRRILFLDWKPTGASWAEIAEGDRKTDRFLDRLAGHLRENYTEDFFFTVHHEPEDDVRAGRSGHTAADYARMYRHVVRRLRAQGAGNLVTVLVHAARPPGDGAKWIAPMYPGDDVVDWIGINAQARVDARPAGELAGLLDRRGSGYGLASAAHPGKPVMIAEWSVWSSRRHPERRAAAYRAIARQLAGFPRIRAMVYADLRHTSDGLGARVDATAASRRAYAELGAQPVFQVDLKR